MFFAIVTDGIATFVLFVEDEESHLKMINDIFNCGRWNSHNVNWADVFAIVVDGITMLVIG